MNKNLYFREIPKVDIILEMERIISLNEEFDRTLVMDIIREKTDDLRKFITSSDDENEIKFHLDSLIDDICAKVTKAGNYNIKKVVNATGTILHTNLGRAVISDEVADKMKNILTGYCNLEYDLDKGKRGERYSHFEDVVCRVTGAESAMAVNNNSAAVMLMLSSLCKDTEVVVSRGELVEIGGAFRVPDVMAASGCKIVEIGTTNKTHARDYSDAVTDETSALLKVHTSNYSIVGFTESVGLKDVNKIAKENNLYMLEDIGSGVLVDLSKYGLTHEPTVQESIKNGIDVVCFSGDKLLGGPQAGIIVGKKELIDKMKKNPLTRAFRIDKFTAMALEMIFHEYLDEDKALKNIPVMRMMTEKKEELRPKADQIYKQLKLNDIHADVSIVDCQSQIGGGSLPLERIDSLAIAIKPNEMKLSEFEAKLRALEIPIIIRIANDTAFFDVRCVQEKEVDIVIKGIVEILK